MPPPSDGPVLVSIRRTWISIYWAWPRGAVPAWWSISTKKRPWRRFEEPEVAIEVDLHAGEESATMWTCDFSHEYVTINGDYRS